MKPTSIPKVAKTGQRAAAPLDTIAAKSLAEEQAHGRAFMDRYRTTFETLAKS